MKPLITLLSICSLVFSQSLNRSERVIYWNSVNINLLGDASVFSINFERSLSLGEKYFTTISFGIGKNKMHFSSLDADISRPPDQYYYTFPHSISANFGSINHFFEMAYSGTFIDRDFKKRYIAHPLIAYRLISNNGRVTFRIFLSFPFEEVPSLEIIYVPIGLSYGINF